MIKEADFIFYPEELFNRDYILKSLSDKLQIPVEEIKDYRI